MRRTFYNPSRTLKLLNNLKRGLNLFGMIYREKNGFIDCAI